MDAGSPDIGTHVTRVGIGVGMGALVGSVGQAGPNRSRRFAAFTAAGAAAAAIGTITSGPDGQPNRGAGTVAGVAAGTATGLALGLRWDGVDSFGGKAKFAAVTLLPAFTAVVAAGLVD